MTLCIFVYLLEISQKIFFHWVLKTGIFISYRKHFSEKKKPSFVSASELSVFNFPSVHFSLFLPEEHHYFCGIKRRKS